MQVENPDITGLYEYITFGNTEKVKFLIENKIDVAMDADAPLTFASYFGHLDIVKILVENKANVTAENNQSLIEAGYKNHLPIIKFLVENKADVTCRDNYPLSSAEYGNHLDTIEYLLSKGADFNKLSNRSKRILLMRKYYRRWRKIVLKKFICKVVTPLYYSPGFLGGEKERKESLI